MKTTSKGQQIKLLEAQLEAAHEHCSFLAESSASAQDEIQRRSAALHMASTTAPGDTSLTELMARAAAFDSFLRGFDDGKDPAPVSDDERAGL